MNIPVTDRESTVFPSASDAAQWFDQNGWPPWHAYYVQTVGDAYDRNGRSIGLRFGDRFAYGKEAPADNGWWELTRREFVSILVGRGVRAA